MIEAPLEPIARIRLIAQQAGADLRMGRPRSAFAAATTAIEQAPSDCAVAPLAELEVVNTVCALTCSDLGTRLDARFERLRLLAVAAGVAGWPLMLLDAVARWQYGVPGEQPSAQLWRLLSGARTIDERPDNDAAVMLALTALIGSDEVAHSLAGLQRLAAAAARHGSVAARAIVLGCSAWLALRTGELATGAHDGAAAVAVCREHGLATLERGFAAVQAITVLERGSAAAAAELPDENAGELRGTLTDCFALFARGRVLLAEGRAGDAVAALDACGAASTNLCTDNPNVLPWRSTLALALAAAGVDGERPRALVADELLRAFRLRQPRAIGVALHARGVLEQGDERLASLREACTRLEATPARLEHARALAALGDALADAGSDEAASARRQALAVALGCGATAAAAEIAAAIS